MTDRIDYSWLDPADIARLGEIDRTERVMRAYVAEGASLRERKVDWNVPSWFPEGDGDHTVAHQISFCRDHLEQGGLLLGASAGERLVGIGLLQPRLNEGLAQLAFLHVSREYRRRGIGAQLAEMMCRHAKDAGASRMYVSATPSAGTVDFYSALGFVPTTEPDPDLLALEPDDIHMIKLL